MPGSLAVREISKSFASVQVLDRVSLAVAAGDRVGVIGPNGIGKSTLLRLLAGLEEPDDGTIVRSGTIGYLPQEPEARPGESVTAFLARRTGVGQAASAMDELATRLAAEPELAEAHGEALDRFLALGGADFDARVSAVLADVGLTGHGDTEVARLSGGEAARAALAAILLARFDVFLLDEPTNNLDFAGLDRLELLLDSLEAGVVLVSHDRAFLDRTVTRIVELEAETRRMSAYAGTWSDYERARDAARERQAAAYSDYVDRRGNFEELLSERRAQARGLGGARRIARRTGGSDRRGTNALRGKVRQAERRLERLEEVEKPWSPWRLRLDLPVGSRSGDRVAELVGAVVERGAFRLGPVDLDLRVADRLAIVGANGAGKTTLIEALVGRAGLMRGTRRVGPSVRFGELDQTRTTFEGGRPLLESFLSAAGTSELGARTLLAKFALGTDDVDRPAGALSPGERTRAALALLAARGANCLILDEPTNHLDLEAIEELETALERYEGTIVVVTHDRRFLEHLAVTRTLAL